MLGQVSKHRGPPVINPHTHTYTRAAVLNHAARREPRQQTANARLVCTTTACTKGYGGASRRRPSDIQCNTINVKGHLHRRAASTKATCSESDPTNTKPRQHAAPDQPNTGDAHKMQRYNRVCRASRHQHVPPAALSVVSAAVADSRHNQKKWSPTIDSVHQSRQPPRSTPPHTYTHAVTKCPSAASQVPQPSSTRGTP